MWSREDRRTLVLLLPLLVLAVAAFLLLEPKTPRRKGTSGTKTRWRRTKGLRKRCALSRRGRKRYSVPMRI